MIDFKEANVKYLDGLYEEAAAMYLAGAEEGCPICACNYGYCLYRGIGVARDMRRAASFFNYASEKVGEACYNLASMYIDGLGVGKNYKKAFSYMHKAATMGVIEAQLFVGVAYVMGTVFEPEVVLINIIPFHTAEQRDQAPLLDGDISLEDFERDDDARTLAVRQDEHAAFEWFRQSARHSPDYCEDMVRKGKYLHARCYIDGLGVDFNLQMGNTLMLDAAVSGSTEALEYLQTRAPYVLDSVKDPLKLAKLSVTAGRLSAGAGSVGDEPSFE